METPQNNKFIYHLTDLENLDSILKEKRLLSRNCLTNIKYSDVANCEIIKKRGNLNDYIPFHFFPKNPFDGAVLKSYPSKNFIYIGIFRNKASEHNFQIIPCHPLSTTVSDDMKRLYSYDEGYKKLNWELINTRDYARHECKEACMSECLCENKVDVNLFRTITVKTEDNKKYVETSLKKYNISSVNNIYVNLNWFL